MKLKSGSRDARQLLSYKESRPTPPMHPRRHLGPHYTASSDTPSWSHPQFGRAPPLHLERWGRSEPWSDPRLAPWAPSTRHETWRSTAGTGELGGIWIDQWKLLKGTYELIKCLYCLLPASGRLMGIFFPSANSLIPIIVDCYIGKKPIYCW